MSILFGSLASYRHLVSSNIYVKHSGNFIFFAFKGSLGPVVGRGRVRGGLKCRQNGLDDQAVPNPTVLGASRFTVLSL